MNKKLLLTIMVACVFACTIKPVATTVQNEKDRDPAAAAVSNSDVWNKYCLGKADSNEAPKVNYKNADVLAASKILNKIAPSSFYLYSGPLKAYGLKSGKSGPAPSTAGAPAGTLNLTHNFLVILCGEFRDRATMIEAKLNWINKINKLAVAPSTKPIDLTKNLWSQITATQYQPYLDISEQLFDFKRDEESKNGKRYIEYDHSSVKEKIDYPVTGQTVCEAKFIFSELIQKKITSIDDYADYKAKFKKFSTKCTADDNNYYYVFRGDSNFKPNSPESNGMIWHSTSVAANCATTTTAITDKKTNTQTTDSDCANYFKSPFANRWGAARSGLATWMLRATKHDAKFSSDVEPMFVISRTKNEPKPYSFKYTQTPKESLADFMDGWKWESADLNFNAIAAKTENAQDFTYKRLRDAVNRHTEWFATGFYDSTVVERQLNIPGKDPIIYSQYKKEAYSPFVASSYVMKPSDDFTAPGFSIAAEGDGRKHWMFIFKVHKDNWYTTKSVKENVPVNFDKHWFDETTFGNNEKSDAERAWDRLGTPMESEFDSILYLHNIKVEKTIEEDGLPSI